MKILAFEFSSARRSVAACEDRSVLGEVVEPEADRTRGLELTRQLLSEIGWKRQEIEAVAVGLGPGSYTGIRTAIALAQGWHLATGVRLRGVNSLEAMAFQLQLAGRHGRAHLAVDAQRGEFYVAQYELTQDGAGIVDPLRLEARELVEAGIPKGGQLFGPDLRLSFSWATDLYPTASAIGMLAAGQADSLAPEALTPVYLRPAVFTKAPPPRWAALASGSTSCSSSAP